MSFCKLAESHLFNKNGHVLWSQLNSVLFLWSLAWNCNVCKQNPITMCVVQQSWTITTMDHRLPTHVSQCSASLLAYFFCCLSVISQTTVVSLCWVVQKQFKIFCNMFLFLRWAQMIDVKLMSIMQSLQCFNRVHWSAFDSCCSKANFWIYSSYN